MPSFSKLLICTLISSVCIPVAFAQSAGGAQDVRVITPMVTSSPSNSTASSTLFDSGTSALPTAPTKTSVDTKPSAKTSSVRSTLPMPEIAIGSTPSEVQSILQKSAKERLRPGQWVELTERQVAGYVRAAKSQLVSAGKTISAPEQIVVADATEGQQRLIWFIATATDWHLIAASKISTGQRGRFDYYITPVGVFENTPEHIDYRAEGTKNSNGIRGFGYRGLKVWDFGWRTAHKGWGGPEERQIRFLIHGTDPDFLEPKLGTPASQGCVRIASGMNELLDHYGALDAQIIGNASHPSWVLKATQKPVFPGQFLVVVGNYLRPFDDGGGTATVAPVGLSSATNK